MPFISYLISPSNAIVRVVICMIANAHIPISLKASACKKMEHVADIFECLSTMKLMMLNSMPGKQEEALYIIFILVFNYTNGNS